MREWERYGKSQVPDRGDDDAEGDTDGNREADRDVVGHRSSGGGAFTCCWVSNRRWHQAGSRDR
jgi:hypothetical protein